MCRAHRQPQAIDNGDNTVVVGDNMTSIIRPPSVAGKFDLAFDINITIGVISMQNLIPKRMVGKRDEKRQFPFKMLLFG